MSQFIKLGSDNFRQLTTKMYQNRTFISSSNGVVGSLTLFPNTSKVEYVQVFGDNSEDDEKHSDYPDGKWFGASGELANYFSGSETNGGLEAEWGRSIHTYMRAGVQPFQSKSNPEFVISRTTPMQQCEDENVLARGDIYTWQSDESLRGWNIKTDAELGYSSDKWYEKIDDNNAYDSGKYKDGKFEDNTKHVDKVLHKLSVNKKLQDIETIKNVLMPYYLTESPSMKFAYCNYHSLNMFTSSAVPPDSAIIYRSPQFGEDGGLLEAGELHFGLSSSFTIETWIKPTGTQQHAGTILHYSGNYALSLITASIGSYEYGDERFKLLFQLASSACIFPEEAVVDKSNSTNLVFTSSNAIKKNNWHHVAVHWDSNKNSVGGENQRRGYFIIDGNIDSEFDIDRTVLSNEESNGERSGLRNWKYACTANGDETSDPRQLVVGNFFKGQNIYPGAAGDESFFNVSVSDDEGLTSIIGTTGDPLNFSFENPLNAEIHEVRIWNKWRSLDTIREYSSSGLPKNIVTNASSSGLVFYLPLLFTEQVAHADKYKYGSYLTQEGIVDGFTNKSTEIHPYPFNVPLAMAVNGHEINITNFVRDFARLQKNDNRAGYPRLYNLTGSAQAVISTSTDPANVLLESPQMIKRNLSIIPCDNGKFNPNWEILSSVTASDSVDITYPHGYFFEDGYNKNYIIETSAQKGVNSYLKSDYSWINMRDVYPLEANDFDKLSEYESVINNIINPKYSCGNYTYLKDGVPYYYIPGITKNYDSNSVVLFNIPNMFYGRGIKRGSFYIEDTNITGSNGIFSIRLQDDGRGNLYRANAATDHAKYNSVGNIFYDEGIVLIKSPHLYFFGKEQYETGFSGSNEVNTHVIEFEVSSLFANSSSHKQYKEFVSDSPAKREVNTIISNVNFYDKDFNVVAKANLNQPVAKEKNKDKFFMRFKIDF